MTATEQLDLAKQLIRDSQAILAEYLPPDGPGEKATISALLGVLDGPRAREVLGDRGNE